MPEMKYRLVYEILQQHKPRYRERDAWDKSKPFSARPRTKT